jgi:choice-of-anchor A domain-containing protein
MTLHLVALRPLACFVFPIALGGAIVGGAIGFPMGALAANLGAANDYNVFVLGDLSQSNTDTEGRVAVGGTVSYSNFTVCAKDICSTASPQEALKVGGDLNATGGTIKGNVNVGGGATTTGTTIVGKVSTGGTASINAGNQGATPTGGVTQNVAGLKTDIDSFFATSSAYLNALSSDLASKAGTTVAKDAYGAITLSNLSSGLNVFNLNSSDLGGASSFSIASGTPSDATVVVNLLGNQNVSIQNFGFNYNGFSRQRVLFNLPDAVSVALTQMGFQGSFLAPRATFTGNNGNIDGTLIVQSLTGTLEAHDFKFQGDLTDPQPGIASVPTPALLPGLVGLGLGIWRRRKRSDVAN